MRKLIAMAVALTCMASTAFADGAEDAKNYVDGVGKQVLGVVNGSGAEADKQAKLRQMFSEQVDVQWMGQFVLGRAWTTASKEQRDRYMAAYKEYLLTRYTTNFTDYTGSKYVITGAKSEGSNEFTVGMQINTAQQTQDVQAGYRVRNMGGSYKIIDIIVEGVSLINTQRSEFSSVVQAKGIDGLIADLEAKKNGK